MGNRKDSVEVRECRDVLFGAPPEKSKEEIEFNGKKFYVHSPPIGVRAKIMKQAGVKLSDLKDMDIAVMSMANIYAAFYCTHTADGHRLFEDADLDAILEFKAGSQAAALIDRLGTTALAMMNKSAEEKAENFPKTSKESSSSKSPETQDTPSAS